MVKHIPGTNHKVIGGYQQWECADCGRIQTVGFLGTMLPCPCIYGQTIPAKVEGMVSISELKELAKRLVPDGSTPLVRGAVYHFIDTIEERLKAKEVSKDG